MVKSLDLLELFELADRELRKKGFDPDKKENREIIYKIVQESYTTGSVCPIKEADELVNLGIKYVNKGIDFLKKQSTAHP